MAPQHDALHVRQDYFAPHDMPRPTEHPDYTCLLSFFVLTASWSRAPSSQAFSIHHESSQTVGDWIQQTMECGFQDWWNDLPHGNCRICVHFGDGLCTEFTPRNCRDEKTVQRHISIGMQARQRSGAVRLLDSNTSLGLLAKHSSLHYLELMIRCTGSTLWPGRELKQGQPRTCVEDHTKYPYKHTDQISSKLVGNGQGEKRRKLSQDGRFQAVSVQEAVSFAMEHQKGNATKRNATHVQEGRNGNVFAEKIDGKEEVSLNDFDLSDASLNSAPSAFSRSNDSIRAEFETPDAHDDIENGNTNVEQNNIEKDFDTADNKQTNVTTSLMDDTGNHEPEETMKQESDPLTEKEDFDMTVSKQTHVATSVEKDDKVKLECKETTKEERDPLEDEDSSSASSSTSSSSSNESSSTSSSSSDSSTSAPSDTMEEETAGADSNMDDYEHPKIHVDFNGIVGLHESSQPEKIAPSFIPEAIKANKQTNTDSSMKNVETTGEKDDETTASSSSDGCSSSSNSASSSSSSDSSSASTTVSETIAKKAEESTAFISPLLQANHASGDDDTPEDSPKIKLANPASGDDDAPEASPETTSGDDSTGISSSSSESSSSSSSSSSSDDSISENETELSTKETTPTAVACTPPVPVSLSPKANSTAGRPRRRAPLLAPDRKIVISTKRFSL